MRLGQNVGRLVSRHSTPALLIVLLVTGTLVLVSTGDFLLIRLGVHALINVVLVVGLFIFVGNSGILSFGHLGFAAISAYETAWLTMPPAIKRSMLPGLPVVLQNAHISPLIATIAGGLTAAVVALLSGSLIMRLSGIAAAIATLAFLAIVNTVYSNSESISGGAGALAGIPMGLSIWNTLGWAALAIIVAHIHSTSASGLALKACREDQVAADSCGIRTFRVRVVAYSISAFVCGIAGSLMAQFLGVINPDSFYLGATLAALAMLIVGGMFTLTGAVAGVVLISALMEALIRLEGSIKLFQIDISVPAGTANFLVAAGLCFVLVKRPFGIAGEKELKLNAGNRLVV